jgi:hypothetical protein
MNQTSAGPTMPAPPPFLPPEPLEVVIKGREDPVAYACSRCGILRLLNESDTAEERAAKREEAAEHCMKVCVCGGTLDYCYRLRCKNCRDKADAEKERKRFDKAEKLSLEEYADDPVFWEGHTGGYGEGYFSGVDELLDYCETEGVDVPAYVWACKSKALSLDGDSILESALDGQEMYEDAGDDIPQDARDRLQAYLDVWTKEVGLRSWSPDYMRAVLLRNAPAAA